MPPSSPDEATLRQALAAAPDSLDALMDLANHLVDLKRLGEARTYYERVFALFPDYPGIWHKHGVLLMWEQREAEAERHLRRALELNPSFSRARFSMSYLLLRQGRFEEGWLAMESRPLSVALSASVTEPRWQGESLAGRSLLIGQEGGFGDMLQLCRYVPILKSRGAARVGLLCQPALERLLDTVPGLDLALAKGTPLPDRDWDLWTLPFSLPHHLGTRLDTIPASIPYLRAAPGLVEAWRPRLDGKTLRVGLAWKGDPRFENDRDRSLPHLRTFAPLAALDGIRFVSLQKGVGEDEDPPPGLDLLKAGPWVKDFADTAALMETLDLVIAVDSAAAHLAGALGRPCWILVPHYKADWRWLTDREDSPWYPTARLFRQGPGETWDEVMPRVVSALTRFQAPGLASGGGSARLDAR